MNVAIIGCGFIGDKRAGFLGQCRLVACADAVQDRAADFARKGQGVEAAPD
jgi:predicted dehydrogenase